MIGTLARKRTQLGALAVLAALAVALFAATISSQASPAIGSPSDTDFIIGDGGNIDVTVENATAAEWTFQPIFGFALTASGSATTAYTGGNARYTHQAGAPTGDFTVRATHATLPAVTKTLTIGEPGTNLATVNVKLGTTDPAGTARAAATAEGAKPETETSNAGTNIFIEVEALNSLGNASNVGNAATTQLSVTVFAVGGVVVDATGGDDATSGTPGGSDSDTDTADNNVGFAVSRSGAGTVEVFAVATIGSTSVRSESLMLTFTVVAGDPAIVSIDDGARAEQGGTSLAMGDDDSAIDPAVDATRGILPVSATDTDGNTATLAEATVITATVKNASDADVTDNAITGVVVARYVLDTNTTMTGNQSGIVVTLPADTAPGEYTVEASLGTSKSTGTLTVTGPAANVDVMIDAPDGTGLGAQLTITATVTDTNGELVAPTAVEFGVGNSPLTLVGANPNTKDGVATRTGVVTGTGVITVVATANMISGVDVIVAGADAAATADVGIDCLSNLAGHSTWKCATGSTASEVFADLASRGASALWLHNGSAWVRYAVRDGAELPGSTDFAIAQYDNLYISN